MFSIIIFRLLNVNVFELLRQQISHFIKSSNFVFNFEHFFYNKIVFNFIMNFRMIIVHEKKRKFFSEIMFNIVIRKFCYK